MDRLQRKALNVRAVLEKGMDPVEILSVRAHEMGIQFWPSMRMNDIHEDDSSRFAVLRSSFKKENRDLLIGSPYPDPQHGYPGDDYTWAFDYSRQEVRERRLAQIEEVCENYDIDGFELDFQRGPWYFKDGEIERGMPFMTELVRQVKDCLQKYSSVRRKKLALSARVPQKIEIGEEKGLDIRRWLEEGVFDFCTPMCSGYLDMNTDLAPFIQAAEKTECEIGAGSAPAIQGENRLKLTVLRGEASQIEGIELMIEYAEE